MSITQTSLMDFDDFHPDAPENCIDLLERLGRDYPPTRILMFTAACLRGRPLDQDPAWCSRVRELIAKGVICLGVHGLRHDMLEFTNISHTKALEKLREAERIFRVAELPFEKVFRGPHWGICSRAVSALAEMRYECVYTHPKHYAEVNSLIDATGMFRRVYTMGFEQPCSAILQHINAQTPYLLHGHTHNVCGNGLPERFDVVKVVLEKRVCISTESLVSCIMPTYNRSERLRERISEVLAQTYSNWELILVSDGCTDDTVKIIEPYLTDPRIKHIVLETNSKSVTIPRNIGISWASGVYIVPADDDVVQYRSKFEELVRVLDTNPDCSLVYGNRCERVDGQGVRFVNPITNWNPETSVGVDNGQLMYRASVYTEQPFVFARRACDRAVAAVCAKHGKLRHTGACVCEYLWHANNRTFQKGTAGAPIYPGKFLKYFNPQHLSYTKIPEVS